VYRAERVGLIADGALLLKGDVGARIDFGAMRLLGFA
jgi:hypothetical protein